MYCRHRGLLLRLLLVVLVMVMMMVMMMTGVGRDECGAAPTMLGALCHIGRPLRQRALTVRYRTTGILAHHQPVLPTVGFTLYMYMYGLVKYVLFYT